MEIPGLPPAYRARGSDTETREGALSGWRLAPRTKMMLLCSGCSHTKEQRQQPPGPEKQSVKKRERRPGQGQQVVQVKSWHTAPMPPMGKAWKEAWPLCSCCVGVSGGESGGQPQLSWVWFAPPPPTFLLLTARQDAVRKWAAWPPLSPLEYHQEIWVAPVLL